MKATHGSERYRKLIKNNVSEEDIQEVFNTPVK